jgi:hypothetical protein
LRRQTASATATDISNLSKRLDVLSSGNGHDNDNTTLPNVNNIGIGTYDDYDYWIDKGMEPPRFAEYRRQRNEAANASEWDKLTGMVHINNITEDEAEFYKRRYIKEHGRDLEPGETVNKTF